MTTSIVIDTNAALAASTSGSGSASAGETAKPGGGRAELRQSFGGVVRSERIKLSSLRSIRITLALTVLSGLGLSALVAFILAQNAPSGATLSASELQSHLLMAASFPAPFLALVFGVLGVFAISSEYTSGMILSTLTAVPRRGRVFGAKTLVLGLLGGLTSLVLVVGGLALAVATMPESLAQLASVPVITGVLGTVVFLLCIALFAFGVAGLLRSTAGGIAVVAGVTFVLPVALQVLSISAWDWVGVALNYTPLMLGNVISQGLTEGSTALSPNFWQSLIAMVVWAAVTVIPAAVVFNRRDAK